MGEMLLFVVGIPGSGFLSAPSGLAWPLDGGELLAAAVPGKHSTGSSETPLVTDRPPPFLLQGQQIRIQPRSWQ